MHLCQSNYNFLPIFRWRTRKWSTVATAQMKCNRQNVDDRNIGSLGSIFPPVLLIEGRNCCRSTYWFIMCCRKKPEESMEVTWGKKNLRSRGIFCWLQWTATSRKLLRLVTDTKNKYKPSQTANCSYWLIKKSVLLEKKAHSFIVLAGKMCVIVPNYFVSLHKAVVTILDCTHHMIFWDHSVFDMADMRLTLIGVLAVKCNLNS